jgi:hypothetical protein
MLRCSVGAVVSNFDIRISDFGALALDCPRSTVLIIAKVHGFRLKTLKISVPRIKKKPLTSRGFKKVPTFFPTWTPLKRVGAS